MSLLIGASSQALRNRDGARISDRAFSVDLSMAFRYRLINADGTDLGPFVSKRRDWKPGDRLGRSKGEDMLITAVIEPEQEAGFHAYLVVSTPASRSASQPV